MAEELEYCSESGEMFTISIEEFEQLTGDIWEVMDANEKYDAFSYWCECNDYCMVTTEFS